jgi:hypothetical protein
MRNKDQILLENAYLKILEKTECECDCEKCKEGECSDCTRESSDCDCSSKKGENTDHEKDEEYSEKQIEDSVQSYLNSLTEKKGCFKEISDKATKEYGSRKAGDRVAGAIKAEIAAKKKKKKK